MKTFEEIPVKELMQAKTETFNRNIEKYLGEFNGNLNGNNMPVGALTADNLVLPVVPETDYAAGGIYKRSSRAGTQAYYDTRGYSWEATDIWTPLLSIDLKNDDWRRGWNRLDNYSPFEPWPLEFQAREGMLVGCATIDWHHGVNRVQATDGQSTYTIFTDYTWWAEWGVFVNNVLVARSGEIYPRRHTTSLPFSIPTGTLDVVADIRFRANTYNDNSQVLLSDPSTAFDIFGAEMWIRNIYR